MGYINAKGATLTNCGIGILVEGDGRVDAEGADLSGCGVGALVIESRQDIEKIIRLPAGPQAQEIAHLLTALRSIPTADHEEFAEKSGLIDKLRAIAVDGSTVVANIATAWPLFVNWIGRVS